MTKRIVLVVMALAASIPLRAHQAPRATPPPPVPASFEGTVLGPDTKPLADAMVLLSAAGHRDPPVVVRTSADGRFRVQARRRGPHTIRVEARGFAAQTLEKVAPGSPLRVTLTRGGWIEGVVRDAASGQPVAGARVEARDEGWSAVMAWEPEAGIVTAETDARGTFKLEGVARGRHTVSASSRTAGRASHPGVAVGARVELLLVAGPSVSGRVLDPAGKPVAGAVVRAESESSFRQPPQVSTNASGRFEIAGVVPGDYRLIARHKDWAVAMTDVRIERTGDVDVDIALAAPVRVTGRLVNADERPLAGAVSLQEIDGQPSPRALAPLVRAEAGPDGRFALDHVPPGAHTLAAEGPGVAPRRVPFDVVARQKALDLGDVVLETGVQIRGRVRDATGAPIADASVLAIPDGPMLPGVTPIEGRTEADGTFTLGGASVPTYRLYARASGFSGQMRVVDAPSQGVELVLEPAGTIAGLVVDDAGRPVETFEVSAMPAGGREAMDRQPPQRRTITSEVGRFSLDTVSPGTYSVQVVARDHGRQVVSDVKVSAGAVTDIGRVRLAAAGAVRGTVVDARSAPVAGATVAARGPGRPTAMGDVQETTTDAAGVFHLRGLPSGAVIVIASHPDFAEAHSAPVEIEPARTAETSIVLTHGGRIEGIVRRRGGAPLPDLRVRLLSPGSLGPMLSATPDPDGRFVLDRIPPGRMHVSLMVASAPGSRSSVGSFKDVDVREGETARVEFVWREILLSGKVTRSGAPLPGIRLTAMAGTSGQFFSAYGGTAAASPGPQRMTAVTREDGSYEMIVTDVGKIMIRAQATVGQKTYPLREIEVADVESQTADLDYPGAGIAGIVVDEETGAPIARASVFATPVPRGRPSGGFGKAGADGRFSIDVDAGEYSLKASADGYASHGVTVTVGESPVTDVRVALPRGVTLRGKVIDSQGRPVPGVSVAAHEDVGDTMGARAESSLDGSFAFTSLRPRSHSISGGSPLSGFGTLAGVSPGDADVVLRLSPGGRIRVRVMGAEEAPIADAYVSVRRVNGATGSFPGVGGRTGGDGTVEIDAPAGTIELEARKDKRSGRVQATVSAGGLAAAEVRLTEGPAAP